MFTFGGCGVLKGLILDNFHFERMWWSLKERCWTVSTLRGCESFEKDPFTTILTLGGYSSPKRTDFQQFTL